MGVHALSLIELFIAITAVFISSIAQAQRGLEPTSHAIKTSISGFPGAFDTFVPNSGEYVASATAVLNSFFPIVGAPVEYGVTENLSLGTNAGLGLLWYGSNPAIGGKIRYRIPFSENFVISFSNWSYWWQTKNEKNATQSDSRQMDLVTAAFFASPKLWFHSYLGMASAEVKQNHAGDSDYLRTSFATSFVGVGLNYMPISWLGLRANGCYPIYVDISNDGGIDSSGGETLSLEGGSKFLFWTFGPDFKLGERWLLSPALLASDSMGVMGLSADVSFRW
jgi:hypothetical protein